MSKKNTAHRPSQSGQEWVTTKDGCKVRNTAYVPTSQNGVTQPVPSDGHLPGRPKSVVEKDKFGTTRYLDSSGLLHNDYGPAIIYSNGDREWYKHGQRHRDGGPRC